VPVVADSPVVVAAAHMHQVVHIDSVAADHNHPAHCTYNTKNRPHLGHLVVANFTSSILAAFNI